MRADPTRANPRASPNKLKLDTLRIANSFRVQKLENDQSLGQPVLLGLVPRPKIHVEGFEHEIGFGVLMPLKVKEQAGSSPANFAHGRLIEVRGPLDQSDE